MIGATAAQEATPAEPEPSIEEIGPAGDLEAIFRKHHAQVFATAFRLTGNAADAEDVLQTVFVRLVRRRGELDLSSGPGRYLHRAAVNAALDLLRARVRSRALPVDELDAVLPDDSTAGPEQRQRDRELRSALRQALLQLSPKKAEIFSLRFLEGLGNQEIASLLGMTQSAVGVAIHRARRQVEKEIRPFVGG